MAPKSCNWFISWLSFFCEPIPESEPYGTYQKRTCTTQRTNTFTQIGIFESSFQKYRCIDFHFRSKPVWIVSSGRFIRTGREQTGLELAPTTFEGSDFWLHGSQVEFISLKTLMTIVRREASASWILQAPELSLKIFPFAIARSCTRKYQLVLSAQYDDINDITILVWRSVYWASGTKKITPLSRK